MTGCCCDAGGDGFAGDFGHVHVLRGVEVWEVGVGGCGEGDGFGGGGGCIAIVSMVGVVVSRLREVLW